VGNRERSALGRERPLHSRRGATRNRPLYLNGSGLPGVYDRLDGPGMDGRIDALLRQVIAGGGIEAATGYCGNGSPTG
jgi:hypothetical protein